MAAHAAIAPALNCAASSKASSSLTSTSTFRVNTTATPLCTFSVSCSSQRARLSRRKFGAARAIHHGDRDVITDEAELTLDSVGVIPSGEWASNFSILNYEDLQTHIESKGHSGVDSFWLQGELTPELLETLYAPSLHREGYGAVPSGEWPENFSLLSYEDLQAHYEGKVYEGEVSLEGQLTPELLKEVYAPAANREGYGAIPTGEWPESFSLLNYEDLQAYYEGKESNAVGVTAEMSPVDNRAGYGALPSGEWPENFSLLNYEDLSAHLHPRINRRGSHN